MAVSLAADSLLPADYPYRLRYADSWGDTLTTLQGTTETVQGYELQWMAKNALPDYWEMVFSLQVGVENGASVLDLDGKQILLEINTTGATWVTVFAGEVVAQSDTTNPGGSSFKGVREYHCRDVLYRLRRWVVDTFYQNTNSSEYKSLGHPGFNTAGDAALAIGNLSNGGLNADGYQSHTWPSLDANRWTDLEALEQILLSTRPVASEPYITVSDPCNALARERVIRVTPGEVASGVVERILRRDSGVVAYLTWADTDGFPSPKIEVYSVLVDESTTTDPSGGADIVISGQDDVGIANAIAVDIQGDQRLGQDAALRFRINSEAITQYDAVELYGEPIVVVVTLSWFDDTLDYRWSAAEAAAYDALDEEQRLASGSKYDHVYRDAGLPLNWSGTVGDGSGTVTKTQCVYRCDENGRLTNAATSGAGPVAPMGCTLLDRLPLYSGYAYYSNPSKNYPDFAAATGGQTQSLVLRRVTNNPTPNAWNDIAVTEGASVTRHGNYGLDMRFFAAGEQDPGGKRFWENPQSQLFPTAITVALVLPYRVGYAAPSTARRIKRLYVPGASLHLMHASAIWMLDEESPEASAVGRTGYTADTGGGGVLPGTDTATNCGIIRDDRRALAYYKALADQWYTVERKSATWALRCQGFYGSWTDTVAGSVDYPKLGQLVKTLAHSGKTDTLNTPITSIHYDHIEGVTTWTTSWARGDFRLL